MNIAKWTLSWPRLLALLLVERQVWILNLQKTQGQVKKHQALASFVPLLFNPEEWLKECIREGRLFLQRSGC
jgi:hypothetical protein